MTRRLRAPIALALLVACVPDTPGETAGTGGNSSTSTSTGGSGDSSDPTSTTAHEPTSSGASTGSLPDLAGADTLLLRGATVVGLGLADVRVGGPWIIDVGALEPLPGEPIVELAGSFLAPGFIDSHTHLLYLPNDDGLARGGIVGAVDLAAPVTAFDTDFDPLEVILAGPMITAVKGYPTQSWGSGGYGIECADAAEAVAAVDMLHDLGAGVIKLPISGNPQLDDAALAAAAARAHEWELKVASHALGDLEAARAAAADADILAHTPTSPLAPSTRAAWGGRTVISTLRAFGGSASAVANLSALHAAGARVLYGTDYGNSVVPGIDGGELTLLASAGLTPAEILAAGTSEPAAFWGMDTLGAIAPGKHASLLVLPADPLQDPLALASPDRVMVRGEWQ